MKNNGNLIQQTEQGTKHVYHARFFIFLLAEGI